MDSCSRKRGQINTIYADFEKAFDKVPHHLLLKKLHSYNLNVKVIQWIRSFLCYRKQRVEINGCYSEWTDVISGIPQGTILGPILFIIYTNDLPEACPVLKALTVVESIMGCSKQFCR